MGKHVVTRFPHSDQLSFLSTALISPFSSNSSAKGSLLVLFFKLGVQKKSAFLFGTMPEVLEAQAIPLRSAGGRVHAAAHRYHRRILRSCSLAPGCVSCALSEANFSYPIG